MQWTLNLKNHFQGVNRGLIYYVWRVVGHDQMAAGIRLLRAGTVVDFCSGGSRCNIDHA